MIILLRNARCALLCFASVAVGAGSCWAQESVLPPQVPLSEVKCGSVVPQRVPPCTTPGTRTVTQVGPLVLRPGEPTFPKDFFFTGTYDVQYDGTLMIGGRPVLGTAFGTDAARYFDASAQRVDMAGGYRAQVIDRLLSQGSAPDWAFFDLYSDVVADVRGIYVDFEGGSDANSFILHSLDPTNIVNNSTAVAGTYRRFDGNSLVFGSLNGVAALVTEPRVTESEDGTARFLSPFSLEYRVAQIEQTRLDESGLVTPKVEVSDGIEMNGSRVTGLGDGIDPGDAVNKGQLDAEAAARHSMDVQLGAAIGDEAITRQQVDLQLSQRLAVQEASAATFTTGLAVEMSARLAADNALSQRIDAASMRLDRIETQMSLLDDRISSSTAIASALSGNAFLPDMKFNLTANVATYDGAHAGSIQMGLLVNPHVALNAGVASGFNRRGKTAARAGMTIGF